jgi:hypothetical protein
MGNQNNGRCKERVEVFSRVVGYFRPVARWNDGKKEEFSERKTFSERKALETDFTKIRHDAS